MELGLYTFADVDPNIASGSRGQDAATRLKHLLEEIELADQVGSMSSVSASITVGLRRLSPSTVLAAAAVKTKNIRLTSAVSVLSSDDPIRVFQQFSTVDLLPAARDQGGGGSFIES